MALNTVLRMSYITAFPSLRGAVGYLSRIHLAFRKFYIDTIPVYLASVFHVPLGGMDGGEMLRLV